MDNLFPADYRVFIEIENKTGKQIDAVITKGWSAGLYCWKDRQG
jgi:hypothetical protein